MDSNKLKAPLMYGIVGPDGTAHIDENCVASSPDQLFAELNGLNDSPDAGYKIVALGQVYLDAAAPQVVADERAAFEKWSKPIPYVLFSDYAWQAWLARAAAPVQADEFESLVAQFIDIIGVTDTGDTLADARSAINKLHKVMAAPVQAQEPVACKTCGGAGIVSDGEINAYPDGTPYMNRPVKCVKDCPDCAKPAAPVQPVALPDGDARPLFDRKLADLEQRGYEVIGRILQKDGQYALFDSSCRWLEKAQYQRLMHEQDGSLFAAPAAQGDALNAKRYEYLRSDGEGIEFRDYGTSPNQWRSDCPSGKELDKIIDAAIAAKAAS